MSFFVLSKLCGLEVSEAALFSCHFVNISLTEKRKQKHSSFSRYCCHVAYELKRIVEKCALIWIFGEQD